MLRVGSLFAGIGGFDLAAERAGMEVVFQSEIDKYASRVLDHHWPHVKNLGDIHGITDPPSVDVLFGGFPCQSYSVAGSRGGLADDRGALWWEFHRLIDEVRPTWVVGENVPGLLSSRGGQDFETIIGSLTELGYGVAWAVLDAQWFGVAQRRRRVFIVGHSGGVPRPEILALGEGVFGHPAPSREKGEGVAPTLASRTRGGGGLGTDFDLDGGLIAPDTVGALRARDVKGAPVDTANPPLIAHGFDELNGELNPELHQSLRAGTKQSTGIVAFPWQASWTESHQEDGTTPTLPAGQSLAIAFTQNQRGEVRDLAGRSGALAAEPGMKQQTYIVHENKQSSLAVVDHARALRAGASNSYQFVLQDTTRSEKDQSGQSRPGVVVTGFKDSRRDGIRIFQEDVSPTLEAQMGTGGNNTPMVDTPTVRRLTPLECERLQGFPDGWTAIPGNSDTQRYRQLGNAVAVPVVEWIMRRIASSS